METSTKIATPFNVILSLYDFLGYLVPGFILLCGIYHSDAYLNNPINIDVNKFCETWLGIVTIVVGSYVLGQVMSFLSKGFERIPMLFRSKTLTDNLFFENTRHRFFWPKGVSHNLLERFFFNYSNLVLKEPKEEFTIKYRGPFIRRFLREMGLKTSDLIWDANMYLLNKNEPSHKVGYVYLSFSGHFRTLTLMWIVLLLNVVRLYFFVHVDGGRALLLFSLFYSLTLISFWRYIKFERMHLYQVIRSLGIIEPPPKWQEALRFGRYQIPRDYTFEKDTSTGNWIRKTTKKEGPRD